MPTWAAVAKTHVFRIRNLLLKWRRKATATDARQPKITQWLSAEARERRSTPGAAGRLTVQQAQAEARASRTRRRARSAGHAASLQSTMRRWARGAPNGTNDSDQTPRKTTSYRNPYLGRPLQRQRDARLLTRARRPLRTARLTSAWTSTGSRSRDALKRCTAGRQLMTALDAAHTTGRHSGAPF